MTLTYFFMRKVIINLALMLMPMLAFANDDVVGTWYSDKKAGIVDVTIEDGICRGKLIWLAEPNDKNGQPYKDGLNKDKSLRDRDVLGIYIFDGLKKEGNEWKGGKVYDPESGNTYNCVLKAVDGKLHVRGFVGPFGKTLKWDPAPRPENL